MKSVRTLVTLIVASILASVLFSPAANLEKPSEQVQNRRPTMEEWHTYAHGYSIMLVDDVETQLQKSCDLMIGTHKVENLCEPLNQKMPNSLVYFIAKDGRLKQISLPKESARKATHVEMTWKKGDGLFAQLYKEKDKIGEEFCLLDIKPLIDASGRDHPLSPL